VNIRTGVDLRAFPMLYLAARKGDKDVRQAVFAEQFGFFATSCSTAICIFPRALSVMSL
jgi:hypothetical protein